MTGWRSDKPRRKKDEETTSASRKNSMLVEEKVPIDQIESEIETETNLKRSLVKVDRLSEFDLLVRGTNR
jgi:hypothetical protein